MAASEHALDTGDTALARPPRSLWKEAVTRLLKNRLSLISGIFIIMMILVAVFAPAIAPHFKPGRCDPVWNDRVRGHLGI